MSSAKPTIRPAKAGDLNDIMNLLKSLQLPIAGVEDHLRNFSVLLNENVAIGCVGLEVYGSKALLRSLAVTPKMQGMGLGSMLYEAAAETARQRGIDEIYLLTETAERFFSARGFQTISRELVDEKVKSSVEFRAVCPQSAVCMRLIL